MPQSIAFTWSVFTFVDLSYFSNSITNKPLVTILTNTSIPLTTDKDYNVKDWVRICVTQH